MVKISFPGGSGGNWLLNVLQHEYLHKNPINFHQHIGGKNYDIKWRHELDPTKFDYLYSGKYYFNFYLNNLYKHFHQELDIFNTTDYKTHFLKCVDTARHICCFSELNNLIFFDYADLIHTPENFYKKIVEFCTLNNFDQIDYDTFLLKREKVVSTVVDPMPIYENFDNMFWVCFVIGQLMNLGKVPFDFFIYQPENQTQCQEFAKKNYQYCNLREMHQADTQIFLPNLL